MMLTIFQSVNSIIELGERDTICNQMRRLKYRR